MTTVAPRAEFKVVGTRPIRPDGADKVTGRATFGADMAMPGMLTGRVKRSPHAHARIVKINTDKARALPGVRAVITAADLPNIPSEEAFVGEGPMNFRDLSRNCMARHKALYDGHAVAAVAATSPAIAEAALDLIEVEYEVLPHVIDVEAAMAPDAPLLQDVLFTQSLDPKPTKPSNIAKRVHFELGDVEKGFREAEIIVEGRYTTKPVHQAYIEPHACVAVAGADGQCQVFSSSQGQFMIRAYCAKLLNIELSNIRVTPAEIGGGFGGTKDGKITAAKALLKYQAGAFPGSPVQPGCMTAFAMYDLANVAVTGFDVVSNRPKVAAYRAPGAPISSFAVESCIDDLARKLKMDPIALREKNAAKDGTKAAYGPTFKDIGYYDTLQAAKNHPHYQTKLGPNQGRGVASGFWFNIGGESSASVHINEDGTAVVVSGNPDIGGSRASIGMMAAEVLGIPVDRVRTIVGDTSSIGYSFMTGGSRVTFAVGMAATKAAENVVEQLKRRAAAIWDISPEAVEWKDGAAVPAGGQARQFDPPPLSGPGLKNAPTRGPGSGAILAD